MKFKNKDFVFAGLALIAIVIGYFFIPQKFFSLFSGLLVVFAIMPFLMRAIRETKIQTEKEEMFLEFARNLVESVKTGTPISKSIINMKEKNFRSLTPHIHKLANQISLGIPLSKALTIFSKDVKNKSISRSLTLIGQAEKAGGDIGEILESVAGAVNLSEKLKKERKASISTLIGQGYIIFVIFTIIFLVLQFQIIPMVSNIGSLSSSLGLGGNGGSASNVNQSSISNAFLYLILVEGFFTGLIIGKLAEGSIKAGIKHSFGLMFLSFLVSTLANLLLG